MRQVIISIYCLCVAGQATSAFAAISISFPITKAQISDGTNSDESINNNPAGMPAVATVGSYSSVTTPVYVTGGSHPNLSVTFTQNRPGDAGSSASGQVNLNFISDIDAIFTATGAYTNSGGVSLFQSYLFDATAGVTVYNSGQVSVGGPAAFTLGGTDGNIANLFEGWPTGILIAGHEYSWYAAATTQASPDGDLGALAGGGATLSLQPVPEFSSVLIWSLIAVAIVGAGWWQQRQLAA